jgi:hypothetical protein
MNGVPLQVGSKYLTKNGIIATVTQKTSNGYLASLPASSISSITELEYTPDGKAINYAARNDNDNQGDYDIVQYLPHGVVQNSPGYP